MSLHSKPEDLLRAGQWWFIGVLSQSRPIVANVDVPLRNPLTLRQRPAD